MWRGASLRSAADEPRQGGLFPFASPVRVDSSGRPLNSDQRYERIARIALGIDLAFVVVLAFDWHGPLRLALGLLFALLIPGWSVVGPFRLQRPSLELSLSVAASLSILMVSAQVLLAVHWWHLWAFDLFAALLCIPVLVWQSGAVAPNRSKRSH